MNGNVQPANAQIDGLFEGYTQPGSPGCALAVMQDGEISYKQGYGLANLEHDVPINPSTVFNIGSMAKQFTAFAIALLEAEGRLSLDDDMRAYLPDMHDFGAPIRLRHLIHHTSGIRCTFPDLLTLSGWLESDVVKMEDVVRLLQAQRDLDFATGSEFAYANSNYILLALICQRVSGQSLADFCQERIFGPLGMTHTVINDAFYKLMPGRAQGYYGDEDGWVNTPLADAVLGPTNVYSTVEDLARWDENFYTGQVGGPAVLERVHQPGRLDDGTQLDYAFGLEVGPKHQHRGWQMVEHGGGHGGYGSWMIRFPQRHLSVVVLFNLFLWGARDYALKVADLFLENKPGQQAATDQSTPPPEAAQPAELSASQLKGKAGKYFNAQRAALRDVSQVEGRLTYQGVDMIPLGENHFFLKDEPSVQVLFHPATETAPARVQTLTPSGEYSYERVEAVSPSPEDLAAYAGRYYSPELDVYWTLIANDDHLVAKRHKYADTRLTPLFADAFNDDWQPVLMYPWAYLVMFERGEAGAVTGLRVSGYRARHIRFVKQTD